MIPGTYRALVGGRTYDVVIDETGVRVNDESTDVSFVPVSGDQYALLVDGESLPAVLTPLQDDVVRVTARGRSREVRIQDERALLLERFGLSASDAGAVREVRAPMPGLVVRVLVAPGQSVRTGDGLIVLEAMKMENELRAHSDGVVASLHASPGEAVGKNALLVEFE